MRAYIVVDLGFGDAGKGLLTDFLVRHVDAGVVVRYNGGAQAGHNVVTPDGRHHTFSQFGSGTFLPHVKTYLSRHVVIHPTALLLEGETLEDKGVWNPFSRLRLSDQALVITPFHQAVNRFREKIRGVDRHGSCGVGIGEAVEDALLHPEDRILAGDLRNPDRLRLKLQVVCDLKRQQIEALLKESSPGLIPAWEYEIFERDDVIDSWISSTARIHELDLIASDSVLEHWLREEKNVIFEGAQGVLLDADTGFHPYTTWSRCTAANALELINEVAPDSIVFQVGVMRSYMVRHGPGPLPTEADSIANVVSEHNRFNEWQGRVRYGWFDAVLARYALSVTGEVDSLVITHLDVLSRLNTWKFCIGYQGYHDPYNNPLSSTPSNGVMTEFHLPPYLSLEQRTQYTQALSAVNPVLKECNADNETVIREIEALIGQQVGIVTHGPRANDVQILSSFPA